MNAIILCGGLSTRLADITKHVPKSLLEIGDRTILDWQLGMLGRLGITEVVLAAGHLADVLQKVVGDKREGIKIKYAIEDKRLGTGGAIKYAWQQLSNPGEPTWVLNGDIISGMDFTAMTRHLDLESDGIILAAQVDDASSYGTLEYDNNYKLTNFKEKEGKVQPGYINGGIYLFTSSIQKYFPDKENFSIEYDVFPNVENLYVYESSEPWIDVGVPERLEWAQQYWKIFRHEDEYNEA